MASLWEKGGKTLKTFFFLLLLYFVFFFFVVYFFALPGVCLAARRHSPPASSSRVIILMHFGAVAVVFNLRAFDSKFSYLREDDFKVWCWFLRGREIVSL